MEALAGEVDGLRRENAELRHCLQHQHQQQAEQQQQQEPDCRAAEGEQQQLRDALADAQAEMRALQQRLGMTDAQLQAKAAENKRLSAQVSEALKQKSSGGGRVGATFCALLRLVYALLSGGGAVVLACVALRLYGTLAPRSVDTYRYAY
jgi:predicted  nucleic acid-binding Zn-ribbon protein